MKMDGKKLITFGPSYAGSVGPIPFPGISPIAQQAAAVHSYAARLLEQFLIGPATLPPGAFIQANRRLREIYGPTYRGTKHEINAEAV